MQKVPEQPSCSGKNYSSRAQCLQLRLRCAHSRAWGTRGVQGRRLGPLTHGLLAVDDAEAAVHAGRQEQVALQGVPPEPPHPALHGHVGERLLHVPRVPQQHVLVVAETRRQAPMQERLRVTTPLPGPGAESPSPTCTRPRTGRESAGRAQERRGLTSPWPGCPPGGGCSGCCTPPCHVCNQRARPQQARGRPPLREAHGRRRTRRCQPTAGPGFTSCW